MIRVLLCGYYGHMGGEVRKLLQEGNGTMMLAAGVDVCAAADDQRCSCDIGQVTQPVDCILDFSHHAGTHALLEFARAHRCPVVIATTGHTAEELADIQAAAREIPVFLSANMSFGVALLVALAKRTAAAMPDAEIEIIEKHHDRKLDAPSGTAKMLVDAIEEVRPDAFAVMGRSGQSKRKPNEIGVHSLRMGNVVGEHEVIVATDTQIITLKHEAHSRSLFAEGAIAAADFIKDKGAGLYDMYSMIGAE